MKLHRTSFNLTRPAFAALQRTAGRLGLSKQKAFELAIEDLARTEPQKASEERVLVKLDIRLPKKHSDLIRRMSTATGLDPTSVVERAVRKQARENGLLS